MSERTEWLIGNAVSFVQHEPGVFRAEVGKKWILSLICFGTVLGSGALWGIVSWLLISEPLPGVMIGVGSVLYKHLFVLSFEMEAFRTTWENIGTDLPQQRREPS
ncbi:hypothetical protein [Pseudohalioglobus lutimaris]|uniref:Uncharacterized protein n=1 Tax=Pseudohalioglobus lutimaris TaxID=1737061 RepID=A0A2N5X4N6_9GAMM|nr:hypothetical protein [Pseudohalioglobus lutimaris]PLW69457.1 hypothetical protein C0039_07985 [Pseudohalioglobus lutimaris]